MKLKKRLMLTGFLSTATALLLMNAPQLYARTPHEAPTVSKLEALTKFTQVIGTV
jgi:hypothetical protein